MAFVTSDCGDLNRYQRVVFNEITKTAITAAFKTACKIKFRS